jgi:uncharacterized protein YycO
LAISRRLVIERLLAAVSLTALPASTLAQPTTTPSRPNTATFESGDLLWPKTPDQWVPYSSKAGTTDREQDRARWEREKARFLKELEAIPNPTAEDNELYKRISALTFEEFVSSYLNDNSSVTQLSSRAQFYVGHVALLDLSTGTPEVIEALDDKNVRKTSYANWLVERSSADIWHGRLSNVSPTSRALIPKIAAAWLGTPYDFWNFDLSNERGFYCSKLVWLAAQKASGVNLDDNPNPRRYFWYSPKRCMRSAHISMLYSPGDYSGR